MGNLNILNILIAILASVFLFVLWLPNLIYKIIIVSFTKGKVGFGKVIENLDAFLDENVVNYSPKCSLIFSMTFEGDLSLEKVKNTFKQNVLEAEYPGKENKRRYPELKQYPGSWMGFRFWKEDLKFKLENHVVQQDFPEGLEMDQFHADLLYKRYKKHSSPWELILVKKAASYSKKQDQENNKSFLFLRTHHCMADAKSIIKLVVECFGNKKLKMAQANYVKKTSLDWILHKMLFPFKYVLNLNDIIYLDKKFQHHPWKCSPTNESPFVVAFSPPLLLSEVKSVAKRESVTASAVLMALVGETLSHFFDKRGLTSFNDIFMSYTMPKANHPQNFTNHVYTTLACLPMNQVHFTQRVRKCNEIFLHLKDSEPGKYFEALVYQAGSMISPLTKGLKGSSVFPFGLSNIAGEEEGFSVGDLPCTDFSLSGGTAGAGVVVYIFSYKNAAKITVVSRENILSYEDARELAFGPEKVLQSLKKSV